MTIRSDKGYVGGKPRIEGTRLWVSLIVTDVEDMGLDSFIEDFELHDKKDKIKEAIEYCMNEQCVDEKGMPKVIAYCDYCAKRGEGAEIWKLAKKLYDTLIKKDEI